MKFKNIFIGFYFLVIPSIFSSQAPLAQSTNCKEIISYFESYYSIPKGLLSAIAMVESKQSPWAINSNGKSKICRSKSEALIYFNQLRSKKYTNINVGCMQINYRSHRHQIKSPELLLNPYNNISYAANYLVKLKNRYGSWDLAVKYYHSPEDYYQRIYLKKVNEVREIISDNNSPEIRAMLVNLKIPSKKHKFIKVAFGPAAGFCNRKNK